MSRIGKQPVPIPDGVTVAIDGSQVTVKGPKGELTRRFDPDITVAVEEGEVIVTRPTDHRNHRALHGLTRALVANMVQGVSDGYERRLRVVGTGYRAEMDGDNLRLNVGYSHEIVIVPPPSVSFAVEDRGQEVVINSPNKELIGQVAADIRKLRPPEPYKGKGIRYKGEVVRQKAGKAGKVGL